MKRLAFVVVAFALAGPVRAQSQSEPNLVLTIFGGATTGNTLWSVPKQPFCELQGIPPTQSCTTLYDTLDLTRDATSSLIAGAMATYYPGPHVGYTAEVYYLGLPLDDTCKGVFFNPDPQADPFYGPRNEQLCANITGAALSTSAIGFFVGLSLRAAARSTLSPYVRGGVGLVTYSSGTIELSGAYVENGTITSRAVYVDDHPKQTAFSGQVAAGLTVRMSPGYQFRIEMRDVLVPLQAVAGPSNDLGRPPVTTKVFQHVALTFGLDVVLEKSHGRRY